MLHIYILPSTFYPSLLLSFVVGVVGVVDVSAQ